MRQVSTLVLIGAVCSLPNTSVDQQCCESSAVCWAQASCAVCWAQAFGGTVTGGFCAHRVSREQLEL